MERNPEPWDICTCEHERDDHEGDRGDGPCTANGAFGQCSCDAFEFAGEDW